MDISMGEWKKSANFVLVIAIFFTVAAAATAYLIVKKPAINIIGVDVAIAGFSTCGFVSMFFFLRFLLTPRISGTQQGDPKGYHINPEEPYGC